MILAVIIAVGEPTTFGELAGTALILLAGFIGIAILFHGWPKFKK